MLKKGTFVDFSVRPGEAVEVPNLDDRTLAELAEVLVDAGRYRWLRQGQNLWQLMNKIRVISPEQLDAAIDAAREDK